MWQNEKIKLRDENYFFEHARSKSGIVSATNSNPPSLHPDPSMTSTAKMPKSPLPILETKRNAIETV